MKARTIIGILAVIIFIIGIIVIFSKERTYPMPLGGNGMMQPPASTPGVINVQTSTTSNL